MTSHRPVCARLSAFTCDDNRWTVLGVA